MDSLLGNRVEGIGVSFEDLKAKAMPEQPDAPHGDDTYTASSHENQNPPPHAFDGNPETRWCAQNGNVPQWLSVDLGKQQKITGLDVTWERDGPYAYSVEVSDDGVKWVTATSNSGKGSKQSLAFEAAARYLRIHVSDLAAGNYASIRELNIEAGK